MKTRIFLTSSLLASMCLLMWQASCSSTSAENNTGFVSTPQPKDIPWLKDRAQQLGNADERVQVATLFDEAVAKVRANANDVEAWLTLTEIYINEARITGDHPYYYPAALDVISRALKCNPLTDDQKFRALSMKGMVEMSLHQFSQALSTAEAAVKLNPYNSGIYGVLVDAHVELGQYDKAVEMADKMISIRPDLRSYSRVSYLREIHGEVKGAADAMELAVSAGYPGYEQTSWCRLTLGHLHETYGDLEAARMHYEIALQERPNYPFAIAAIAGIHMKKKNYTEAEAQLQNAIAMIPEVSFSEQLAELYSLTGREEQAQKTWQQVLAMLKDDADHGHSVNLEVARVWLHGLKDPVRAREFAVKEYLSRPGNIEVNRVMAEISYRENSIADASMHITEAMKTHSQDPELIGLAGLIRLREGKVEEGKKLIQQSLASDPYQSFAITADLKAAL